MPISELWVMNGRSNHTTMCCVQRIVKRDAFQKLVAYVLLNPVRKKLVERWEKWTYLDSIIPGYPEVSLRDEDYWERFWRIYYSKG